MEQKERAIAFESMLLKYAGNEASRTPGEPAWISIYGVLLDFGSSSELRLFQNVQESASEQVSFTASETVPVRSLRKISQSPENFPAVGLDPGELSDNCFFVRYLDKHKVAVECCFKALRQDTAVKWLRALKSLAKRDLAHPAAHNAHADPAASASRGDRPLPSSRDDGQRGHDARIGRRPVYTEEGRTALEKNDEDSDTLSRSSVRSDRHHRRHHRHEGKRKHRRRDGSRSHRLSNGGSRSKRSRGHSHRRKSSAADLERALRPRHRTREEVHNASVRRTLRKFKKFLETEEGHRSVLREAVSIAKRELALKAMDPDDDSAQLTKDHLVKAQKSLFQKAKQDLVHSSSARQGTPWEESGTERRSRRHDRDRGRGRQHSRRDPMVDTKRSSSRSGRGGHRQGDDTAGGAWWKKHSGDNKRGDNVEVRVPLSYIEQLTSPAVPPEVKRELERSLRHRAGFDDSLLAGSQGRYIEGRLPQSSTISASGSPSIARTQLQDARGTTANAGMSVVQARKNALKRNTSLCYLVDDQELSQVTSPLCVGYHTVATYNDNYFAAIRRAFGVDYDFLSADRFDLEPFLDEQPPEVAWSTDRLFVVKLLGPEDHRRLVASASLLPECFGEGPDSATLIVPVFAHFRIRRSEGADGGADLVAVATGRSLPSAAPDFMWNHNLFQMAPSEVLGAGGSERSSALQPLPIGATHENDGDRVPAVGIFYGQSNRGGHTPRTGLQQDPASPGRRRSEQIRASASVPFTEAIHVHQNPRNAGIFPMTPAQRERVLEVVRRDTALLDRMGLGGYSLVVGFYEEASEKMLARKGGRFPAGTTMPATTPFVCRCQDPARPGPPKKVLRAYYLAIALFMDVSTLPPSETSLAASAAFGAVRNRSSVGINDAKKSQRPVHSWDDGAEVDVESHRTPVANGADGMRVIPNTYGKLFFELVASKVTNTASFQPHPLASAVVAQGVQPVNTSFSRHGPSEVGGTRPSTSMGGDHATEDLERHCKSAVWYYDASLEHASEQWVNLGLQDLGINAVYRTQVVHCRNSRMARGPTGTLLAPGDILAQIQGQSLRGRPMSEVRGIVEDILRRRERFEPVEFKVIPSKLLAQEPVPLGEPATQRFSPPLPLSDALAHDDGTAHAIVSAAQTLSNNFRNGQLDQPEDLVAFALGYAERSGLMPRRPPGAASPSKIARRALREDSRARLDKVTLVANALQIACQEAEQDPFATPRHASQALSPMYGTAAVAVGSPRRFTGPGLDALGANSPHPMVQVIRVPLDESRIGAASSPAGARSPQAIDHVARAILAAQKLKRQHKRASPSATTGGGTLALQSPTRQLLPRARSPFAQPKAPILQSPPHLKSPPQLSPSLHVSSGMARDASAAGRLAASPKQDQSPARARRGRASQSASPTGFDSQMPKSKNENSMSESPGSPSADQQRSVPEQSNSRQPANELDSINSLPRATGKNRNQSLHIATLLKRVDEAEQRERSETNGQGSEIDVIVSNSGNSPSAKAAETFDASERRPPVLHAAEIPDTIDGPILRTPVPGERRRPFRQDGRDDRSALRLDASSYGGKGKAAKDNPEEFPAVDADSSEGEFDDEMPRTPGGHLSKSSPYDNGILTLSTTPVKNSTDPHASQSRPLPRPQSQESAVLVHSPDKTSGDATDPARVRGPSSSPKQKPQEGKQSDIAVTDEERPLFVGHSVFGLYSGDTRWYSGKVSAVDVKQGTVSIKYDDGDVETDLPLQRVRRHVRYKVGDRVSAQYGRAATWYDGTVTGIVVTNSGEQDLYDIRYDDGDTDTALDASFIRPIDDKPPKLSSTPPTTQTETSPARGSDGFESDSNISPPVKQISQNLAEEAGASPAGAPCRS